MLPRQFRLDRKEFEIVKRSGRLRSGRLMGVLVGESGVGSKESGVKAKAGIIVSKRLSKKSTERNKLKRRLRAALVRVLPELSDVHLVVLPTKRAMGARVTELKEELKSLLNG